MAFYQFIKTQKLPVSVSEIWDFISSPGNLKDITPEEMDFAVTSSNCTEKMYAGMIITYKVKPLMGMKMNWMTEITHVRDYEYFVDEQRIGPYSLWHHQHKIEPIEGGVLMTDIVTYQPPFGLIGALINLLTIRNKLRDIFIYREMALEKRFGKLNS